MGEGQNDQILKILTSYRNWAIVGASDKVSRPSNDVMRFLDDHGYNAIPINPRLDMIETKKCFPTLLEASEYHSIEVVDIFRKSADALKPTLQAIEIGAKAVWFQLGIVNFEATEIAKDAGLEVVVDACPKIELPRIDPNFRMF